MTKQKYIDDLKDIKEMMDRSSKFISLSGLSGISAGIFALIGAYLAYETVYTNQNYLSYKFVILNNDAILKLIGIATATLILSLVFGIYFTNNRAKKLNQKLLDSNAKRLIINLFIPLICGGVLCLILLSKGLIGLIAPLTLIFYGLGLINASKYTLSEIRSLGILEIILGLIGTYFIGFGLIFWAIGFGVFHIIYGIIMHFKYKS